MFKEPETPEERHEANQTSRPAEDAVSLSWNCAFCPKLRIYEGGRPCLFDHLEICGQCGSRVATEPTDRAAIAALIDRHLL